jgi:hypothetical protein
MQLHTIFIMLRPGGNELRHPGYVVARCMICGGLSCCVLRWSGGKGIGDAYTQSANNRGTADIAGPNLVIGLRTELNFKREAEVRIEVVEGQTSSKALSLGFSFVM